MNRFMKGTASWPAVAVWALLLAGSAQAATTEFKYYNGTCNGGNVDAWWCVIEFKDGVAVRMSGLDCRGHYYQNVPVKPRILTTDPLDGEQPNATGVDAGGNEWIALVRFDENNYPTWIGGRDGNGAYWLDDAVNALQ